MKHSLFWMLLGILLCLAGMTQAQNKFTLSGYIKDAATGETLIGATATAKGVGTGSVTNAYGFYSLSLPPGTYTIEFSYVGYTIQTREVNLTANVKLDVELAEKEDALEEVVVTAEREDANVKNVEMSTNRLDIKTVQRVPALLGEVDLVRAIQLLPGVSTVGEGATGFNVRGGNIDQNLVLLDEAPVYNSSHLFGFFSVFNPDAVKDVKLIKGGIPAQYGGRLSSILDVRMKEGNAKQFSASGGIGVIFSRLTLEAPIVKDKGSFIVAARRSYIDILARPFLRGDLSSSQFYFYDLTAKANYQLGKRDKIFLSGYLGRDVFGAGFNFNWGNSTATLRWNHLFSDRLFLNLTTFYSNYDYRLAFGQNNNDRFDWNANVINYSVKPELTYYLNPKNTITFGGQATYYQFRPGNAQGVSQGQVSNISLPYQYALETALYIANEQTVSDRVSLQYGLRYSRFNYYGAGIAYYYDQNTPAGIRRPLVRQEEFSAGTSIATYGNFEPRFALKYELTGTSSIKASYNRMVQYLHLMSNTAAASPLDIWTPSTNNIKPQIADQWAMGYFTNLKENSYELSAEAFYKTFQNQVDYINGSDLLLNRFLEGDLMFGTGRAYGLEVYAKKNKGKVNGWVSYTLSRSERQVEGINNGNWFPTRFNRTHNLTTVLTYDHNTRWSFSATFTYQSGTPSTFPTNRIDLQGYLIPHNVDDTRNNFNIPAFHRLDLSATLQGKQKPGRRWESYWVFSVYNIYNRRNPYSIYFRPNVDNPNQPEAVRLAIIGAFVPGVSYNFKY